MEHTINACGHANSTVHENMQSLIEQSGSVRNNLSSGRHGAKLLLHEKGQCKGVYEFR